MTAASLGAVDLPELPEAMGMTELGRAFTAAQMRDYARAAIAALTPAAAGAWAYCRAADVDRVRNLRGAAVGVYVTETADEEHDVPVYLAPPAPPPAARIVEAARALADVLPIAREWAHAEQVEALRAALSAPPPADAVRALVGKWRGYEASYRAIGKAQAATVSAAFIEELEEALSAAPAIEDTHGNAVKINGEWMDYRDAAAPTPEGREPMWPTDPWEALRRIEGMGGPASYVARECLRATQQEGGR